MSGVPIPRETGRYYDDRFLRFTLPSGCVLFSFMQRLFFFTPKRVATESEDQGEVEETKDEGGEISTTASQPAEVAELPVEPTASTSTTVRKIRKR